MLRTLPASPGRGHGSECGAASSGLLRRASSTAVLQWQRQQNASNAREAKSVVQAKDETQVFTERACEVYHRLRALYERSFARRLAGLPAAERQRPWHSESPDHVDDDAARSLAQLNSDRTRILGEETRTQTAAHNRAAESAVGRRRGRRRGQVDHKPPEPPAPEPPATAPPNRQPPRRQNRHRPAQPRRASSRVLDQISSKLTELKETRRPSTTRRRRAGFVRGRPRPSTKTGRPDSPLNVFGRTSRGTTNH